MEPAGGYRCARAGVVGGVARVAVKLAEEGARDFSGWMDQNARP